MSEAATVERVRCTATTKKDGKPCPNMAVAGTDRCYPHGGRLPEGAQGPRAAARAKALGSDEDGATRRTVTGEIDRILQSNPRRWAKIITDRVASGRDIPPGWHRMLELDRAEAPKPVPVPSTMEKARSMSTADLEALVLQLRSEA